MATRRPPRRLTKEKAAEIKKLRATTDLHQDEIAGRVNLNPGRVSEVLTGKRYPDVQPAL